MKKIHSFVMKRRAVSVGIGILFLILIYYFFFRGSQNEMETLVVSPSDFLQQVSVSGKVTATETLDLSFEQGGRVESVSVKVGDKITTGQLLASQNVAKLNAELLEMKAGVDVAKAKQTDLLDGFSPEEIQIAKTDLSNDAQKLKDAIRDGYTKADDAVKNYADRLFNMNGSSFDFGVTVVSENTTYSIEASDYNLRSSINNARRKVSEILADWPLSEGSSSDDSIKESADTARGHLEVIQSLLDTMGLAINNQHIADNAGKTIYEGFKTAISTARSNISTALSNLITAQNNFRDAQAELALKEAPVRSPDAILYDAQVRQAEAQVQNILAELYQKQIHAPFDGIVTAVNSKVGSVIASNETLISVIKTGAFEIESYVPEKSIPFIELADLADVTLDAYGDTVLFQAKVITIDPAETIRDGVSTYRIKLQFVNPDSRIKPGMTANVVVTTEKKSNVIAVPQGIVEYRAGKKFVKIQNGSEIEEKEVKIGSVSSYGEIEIISGLVEGDTVILKQAQK